MFITRFRTRWILAGVFIATGTLGTGIATVRPAHAQAKYVSPTGFSFVAPKGWKRDDAEKSMGRVRYTLTEPTQGRVLVSLATVYVADGSTLESLAEKVRTLARENGDQMTIVSDKSVRSGAVPGVVIVTNNARPSEPDTEMTFVSVKSGKPCQIVLKCKTADAAKYKPAFDKAVATFAWK
ncbi:MAG: hypothetical protein H7145_01760 [Akkermansiaceae bacterium]|nr:hypothetical protein [Armatimonadota bacterium]